MVNSEKGERIVIPYEIKQQIFSHLSPKIKNNTVLDIYSDGSLGIASLNKGAQKVEFVESDPQKCNLIRKKISQLNFLGTSRVFEVTAYEFSEVVTSKYDLIFAFLPKGELNLDIIKKLAKVLKKNGLLVYSCSLERSFPDNFDHTRSIKKINFGNMKVIFIHKYQ